MMFLGSRKNRSWLVGWLVGFIYFLHIIINDDNDTLAYNNNDDDDDDNNNNSSSTNTNTTWRLACLTSDSPKRL